MLRLGVAHDLFAEGREREAGELEVLNREWDRDDRNAQQDAGNEVRERQIPAAEHKPEDVAAARSEGRGTRPIGDGPTEWPDHEARELERLDAKRDRDDEDAAQDPGDDVGNEEPDPGQKQPDDVADSFDG